MTQSSQRNFIDLHSHLLPGIDDGCTTIDESLACIDRLRRHGFVGSVCTPHYLLHQFPDNTPENIAHWVRELNAQLEKVNIDYQLWTGAEVRITEDTVDWFEQTGVPTLGPSRWVLIDYWGRSWPGYARNVIDYLFEHGYQPVLAHPERMEFDEGEWKTVVADLRARGVQFQGNLNSFSGGEGDQAQRRMQFLCNQNGYELIASDTHRPWDMDGRMLGIQLLDDAVGASELDQMLSHRANAIVSGAAD